MCFLFYRWGKWEKYKRPVDFYYDWGKAPLHIAERWQRRICRKCGFVQRRKLNDD